MFKIVGQQTERRRQKSVRLWNRDFDVVPEGLDEKQVISFINSVISQQDDSPSISANSLLSLVERALADAEQLVSNVKEKALADVQNEVKKITDKYNIPLIINDRLDVAQARLERGHGRRAKK